MLATAKRGIDGNSFDWQLFLIWQVLQDSLMLQIYLFDGQVPGCPAVGLATAGRGARGALEHWALGGEHWVAATGDRALAAATGGCSQHCCSPPLTSRTTFASLHNDRNVYNIPKSQRKEILQLQRFLI